MGRIAHLATAGFTLPTERRVFYEIEAQVEAFRVENQAQHLNVQALTQEIQALKGKQPTPEPELQRGDFVSYLSTLDKKKVWGIFHYYEGSRVVAYWQNDDGGFSSFREFMVRDRVTFEFRPEK